MFENQPSLATETKNPALSQAMAVEQLVAPIARLWARSFSVLDEGAVSRLSKILADRVRDQLASGVSLDRISSHFDEVAGEVIREWFSFVLGRELPKESKPLAILRLAFIDANYDGKWSTCFLSRDICVQELASELDSLMIEPTPQAAPCAMVRQVF